MSQQCTSIQPNRLSMSFVFYPVNAPAQYGLRHTTMLDSLSFFMGGRMDTSAKFANRLNTPC